MIRWGPGWDESLWFRREDAADYWDGEGTRSGPRLGATPPPTASVPEKRDACETASVM